ncbi:MAG: RHS repeat-associated core domain-containing protein [Candidatus Kapaibacterium sp.]|nr:MAG: RHS repeat-associated core domain-containing protein [Candidatus Kapabacteria bacterium]
MILGYHEQDFVKSGSVYDSSHSTTSSWHVPNPTFLYNGNISSWAWNSRRATGATDTAMASVYHYDLLNRIRTDSTRLRGATAWSAVGSHWQSSYTYDGNGNIQTLYRANATGSQMDNLTYTYTTGTNKLINIADYQGASTGADIGDQDGNNYAYDATGNMTQDTAAGIEAGGIVWSPYNKIKSITKMGDDTTSKLVYHYDATGNRILKRYYKPYNTLKSTTWYVRDAQGNTLATYTKPADSSTARQHEVMLYGSTRLAVAETQAPYSDSETDTLGIFDRVSSRTLGTKRYELTDHLGNVRATVTDVVIDHSGDLDAELSTRTDYYPFGMIMGGRNSSADDAHRYGFNGKENDNEIKGEGVQQDYGFRIYDARVARFLSVDPLSSSYPMNSTYMFAENKPIAGIDLEGLEFFYCADGTFLGQGADPNNRNVFLSTKSVVSKNTQVDANTKVVTTDWRKVQDDKATLNFTQKTGADNDLVEAFAAVIHHESSGKEGESYRIANVTMNFLDQGGARVGKDKSTWLTELEDVVFYDNSFAQGATLDNYQSFCSMNHEQKNSRQAVGAALNAIGYSSGVQGMTNAVKDANAWDGLDLVDSRHTNSHRKYKWTEESKDLLSTYSTKVNAKVRVDVSKWTYVKKSAQIKAVSIEGGTLYQRILTGRGEKKQSTTKFEKKE